MSTPELRHWAFSWFRYLCHEGILTRERLNKIFAMPLGLPFICR